MKPLRVAATQLKTDYRDVESNLEAHAALTKAAAAESCDLIAFPECSVTGLNGSPDIVNNAEELGDRYTQFFWDLAATHEIVIAYGFCELFRGTHFNSHAVVGPDGLIGVQRKVHLSYDENFLFRPAYNFEVFDIGKCKIGIAICHDGDFFETWRSLAVQGAEVVLLPHAIRRMFSSDNLSVDVSKVHLEASDAELLENQGDLLAFFSDAPGSRWFESPYYTFNKFHNVYAKTNGVFAVFSDMVGFDGHTTHIGGAYVMDPSGHLIEQSKPSTEDLVIIGELDPRRYEEPRQGLWFPLRKRKPEAYGELSRSL